MQIPIVEIYCPHQYYIRFRCVILVVIRTVDTVCMVHAIERKMILENKESGSISEQRWLIRYSSQVTGWMPEKSLFHPRKR